MDKPIFYDAGPVITKARFVGFCYILKKDRCTHVSCGYKEPELKCPKCGRTAVHFNFSYDRKICTTKEESDAPWTGLKHCTYPYKDLKKVGGKKKKCKKISFRSYTQKEMAKPTEVVRYALIEVQLAAIEGWHRFVADLQDEEFVNHEMKLSRRYKTVGWTAYQTDSRCKVDLTKIINKKEVIKQIGVGFQ